MNLTICDGLCTDDNEDEALLQRYHSHYGDIYVPHWLHLIVAVVMTIVMAMAVFGNVVVVVVFTG